MYKRADGTDLEALEIMANAACKRYVGIKEGAMLYSLGLHLFSDLAKDAGAKRVRIETAHHAVDGGLKELGV